MLTRLGLVSMLTQPLHIAAEAADVDRLLQLARTTNALVTVMVADMQRYASPFLPGIKRNGAPPFGPHFAKRSPPDTACGKVKTIRVVSSSF
jgi:hypothetical protein